MDTLRGRGVIASGVSTGRFRRAARLARRPEGRRRLVGALARVRGPAIPIATTAPIARAARRTLFAQILLALVLIGFVVAASQTERGNAAAARGLLSGAAGGMPVLHVSRSIKAEGN